MHPALNLWALDEVTGPRGAPVTGDAPGHTDEGAPRRTGTGVLRVLKVRLDHTPYTDGIQYTADRAGSQGGAVQQLRRFVSREAITATCVRPGSPL